MALTFFWVFLLMLFLGVGIFFSMIIATILDMYLNGNTVFLNLMISRMYNGINSFPMMAVPFFILAGEIMNTGGTTKALVEFSKSLIGHIRGGLAHVNILASILFAGLSGSAVADTSALGSMLIPAMEKAGYPRRFSAAVTAASSVIGPIIPPSGLMVLYAFTMEVSISAMFMAGFVPGLMIGLGLMIVSWIKAKDYKVRIEPRATLREKGVATRKALVPLFTPIILLGGILSGYFTPTEAAAVAVCYAFLSSLLITRTMTFKDLPPALKRASKQTGNVLLLVCAATVFSTTVALSGMTELIASEFAMFTDNKYVLLFVINIFLLFVGMFLDAGPAILILGPILQPLTASFGIDPVHFSIVMCVNVTVGLATPPMGLVLFVSSSISGEKLAGLSREILPFLAVEILVILLISFFPDLVLTLPRLCGLM